MKLIAENNNAYLIVDIIYDNGEDWLNGILW
jgi:hypothetical protein